MLRRWLDRLAGLRAAGSLEPPRLAERPLPSSLTARLQAIPRQETLCRDVDRSWVELARGELAVDEAARLREHLHGCGRCARVWSVMETAVTLPERQVPFALLARLTRLARGPVRRPLPFFWRDARYAAMASALLTLILVLATGGDLEASYGRLSTTGRVWTAPMTQVLEKTREQELMRLRSAVSTQLTEGRESLEGLPEAVQHEARQAWERMQAEGAALWSRVPLDGWWVRLRGGEKGRSKEAVEPAQREEPGGEAPTSPAPGGGPAAGVA